MKMSLSANGVLALGLFSSAPVLAQTEVLTNGSFESGLTGWTTATKLAAGAGGNCSYNGVTALGTETLTSLAGFPATDGTQTALGSVADTTGTSAIISCVLYQDVAIPAGATTATFTFDIGVKGNINGINNGYKVAIYSAAAVPGFSDATLVGSTVVATPSSADTTLQGKTSGSFNVSARAGQTVRFAIINGAQSSRGEMIGVDNVKFLVNTAAPVNVPTLSEWSMVGLGLLLGCIGLYFLRYRPA